MNTRPVTVASSRRKTPVGPRWRFKATAITPRALVAFACMLSVGADSPGDAASKVREGLQYFRGGEFAEAETAFDEAARIDPENATIKFDEACAALAGGDAEQARGLFQAAAFAKDAALSLKAHYNLGCLEADLARGKLGDDPAAAVGETREESVNLLLASVRHYRDVLRLQPKHNDARHNLELIRLYIKHIQSQWAERDKQRDRQEKDLLQFLQMLEQKETALRSATGLLQDHPDSASRRQALRETGEAQRTLAEEIDPLKQKIAESLQPQQGAPGQPQQNPTRIGGGDEQSQQALQIMHGMADEIGSRMLSAANAVANANFDDATASQTESLNLLNQLYMAAAPYDQILSRSIKQQQRLAPPKEPETTPVDPQMTAASEDTDETTTPLKSQNVTEATEPRTEPGEGFRQVEEDQSRVTDWTRVLPLKAEAALPQVQQQLETMKANLPAPPLANAELPAADLDGGDSGEDQDQDDGSTDGAGDEAADAEQQQVKQQVQQLEGLIESMMRAVDLGPAAEEHSRAAVSHLAAANLNLAEPEQAETLRILKEIAKPLQDEQNQDQQQDNQDQQGEDQQQDEQDQQDSGSDQEDQQQNQDNGEQQRREQERRKDEAQQQQAESVLRQARERERKHREMQKELRAILGQQLKVDKDW